MKYPGNENLAEEIRGRILNTFRQTLDLAEKGDVREAQLGCDFVLRLDPTFEPARQLSERLKAPDGQVDVADLRAGVTETGDLDPELPPREPAGSEEPVVELDLDSPPETLDSPPETLDSALDLSSLESVPVKPAPSPPPPAPAAPAAPTAGTEPIAALDNESERRVDDLLNEGQAAFERAEYQSAIDAWSRIFLIDIDHPEANRRIDLARKLKAEVERKLEETYHDAVGKVESGRLDEARQGFAAVLEIMPGHVAAQEYLARLDAPDFAAPDPATSAAPGLPPVEALDDSFAGSADFPDDVGDVLDADLSTVPDSGFAEPPPAIGGVGKASRPARDSNQTFKTVGAVALVLLAVVGWFLYKNWATIFPNASDQAPAIQTDPITRAKRTYAEAGAAIAIAQLRRLSPGHPQYAEAQALVAQWEATLDASKSDRDEPAPEALADRDRLVNEARAAFSERRYLGTEELLSQAASHAPLDDDATEMLGQTEQALVPIRGEIVLFREGEWDFALRNLWRIWESGNTSPDVRRLMVDSYFNLGVRDLQRNDPEAAIGHLQEAGELASADAELARLIEFAQAYQDRSDDLLYRIFVKYQPFR